MSREAPSHCLVRPLTSKLPQWYAQIVSASLIHWASTTRSADLHAVYTDVIWANDPTDWLTALVKQTPQQPELGKAVEAAIDSLAQIRDDFGTRLTQVRKRAVCGLADYENRE